MSPKLFGHSLSNDVQPLFAFPKSCGPIISVQLLKRLGHRRKWTRIISVRFIFNDENYTALEIFIRGLEHEEDKRTAMAMLLNAMVPKVNGTDTTPLSILGGCRVLPRPNLQ